MSRIVYISGFGNGKRNAEGVASALEAHHEGVDFFTFSEAMQNPDKVRKAVEGVNAMTHSAGMLALMGTKPKEIDAFNAPLPTSKLGLVAKTLFKTARMHIPGIGIKSPEDILSVGNYDASASAELAVHPVRNIGHLGQISRFHAVGAAIIAQESGTPTSLGYTTDDEYFRLSPEDMQAADAGKVNLVLLPGIHDELVIRPERTLSLYLGAST